MSVPDAQCAQAAVLDPYPPCCTVEGIRVAAFANPQSLFERILLDTRRAASAGRQTMVHYLNVHVANTAFRHRDLQRILGQSSLVYCDGAGVKAGAWLLGQHIPTRLTAADWFLPMLRRYAESGITVFLLGGAPGVPEAAIRVIDREAPGHTVVGVHHGHILDDERLEEEVVSIINRVAPDMLIVGFGTPLQELWIEHNAHRLQVSTFHAVGATMDFISGQVRRCPPWMGRAGLEWLFRLCTDPRRLMSRYLMGNPWFLGRMASRALVQKWKGHEALMKTPE
jgi:N-acetylglucosaminyldiphosphoundecaprenol N-acetyl-beta-D-mannosaminyltransferase